MTNVGFPDFQEQAQWQSPLAVTYNAALANGATKSFPASGPVYFNVSNWNATQLRISGSQILDVELIWYDAIPANAYLARTYYSTVANIGSAVSFPNAGPYLQINVSNLSGVNDTLLAVVAFTNRRQQPFIAPASGPLISAQNVNVPPGTVTLTPTHLFAGPAFLNIYTASGEAWQVNVDGRTSNGTADLMCVVTSGEAAAPNIPRRQAMTLLPRPTFATIFNLGAAAHTFYVAVTPDMMR
jgi:hypothetical protein